MHIHEAIQATTAKLPCVTRRGWDRLSKEPVGGIKIQPTNSPDGCIIESDVNEGIRRVWQPTAADLVKGGEIMSKEKELLRKQLALLAEQSVDALGGATSSRSEAMCKVYKTLVADKLVVLVSLCVVLSFNLAVYGAVKIEKLLRREG